MVESEFGPAILECCLVSFAAPEATRTSRLDAVNSTYHEVFEHQIWFPFMKGLVRYNKF